MLLYSVAKVKTKEWNPGRDRGQTRARQGHSLLGLGNEPKEGKLIQNLTFRMKGFLRQEYLWKKKTLMWRTPKRGGRKFWDLSWMLRKWYYIREVFME